MGEHLAQPPERAQPSRSWKPQPKVQAGGLAGALSIALVWILASAGVDIPEPVATAIGAVVATVLSYLIPAEGMREH